MKRIVLSDENKTEEPQQTSTSQPPAPQPLPKDERAAADAQRPKNLPRILPPEFISILAPSLQVGMGAGVAGVVAGGGLGIIRSAPPVLFALATGVQWFTLGSSYYAGRLSAMKFFGSDAKALSSSEMVKSSAMAGGFAGAMGGLLRGPRNILPATFVFTLFGACGQAVASALPRRQASSEPSKGFLHSKWSPLKPLSDDEYRHALEEKLLRVEADIAIIDEHLKELQDADESSQQQKDSSAKS